MARSNKFIEKCPIEWHAEVKQNSNVFNNLQLVDDEMSEEIDKHVLNKYEIQQKLGKGVRF